MLFYCVFAIYNLKPLAVLQYLANFIFAVYFTRYFKSFSNFGNTN
jgi:hypothetical protein